MSSKNNFPITMIKLKGIIHSHTNPSDRDVVDDLAASIKAHGLLNPITVRPSLAQKGKFEIVAGERRFRAYELNKETEIPAFIREISDDEALTLQTVENLQREDISPIDEAKQFALLLKKQKIEWLCDTISKPIKYVQDRLKLNDLTAEGIEYVRKGILPLGHAIMISKLTEPDQIKCIEYCIDHYGDAEQVGATRADLRDYIESELILDMERAPFDLADTTLNPAYGACTTCPMRTINAKLLFSDMIDEDACTNRKCYEVKLTAHIDRAKQTAKDEYDKVAVGTKSLGNKEIKVGGKALKYSETPVKGSTPVVVTKTDSPSGHSDIGKVVHVIIPPKVDKKSIERPAAEDWQTEQKRIYTEETFPHIMKAVEIYMNEDIDLSEVIRSIMMQDLENKPMEVVGPFILKFSGMAVDAETSRASVHDIQTLLKNWKVADIIPLWALCNIIADCYSFDWYDMERTLAPQFEALAAKESPPKKKAGLKDILPPAKPDTASKTSKKK